MYLRKVVNWISDNQHLSSNKEINEWTVREPNTIINKSTNDGNRDVPRSTRLGDNTSVLDFSFLPGTNSVPNTGSWVGNKHMDMNRNHVSFTSVSQSALESKDSKINCNSKEEEIFRDKNSQPTEIMPIDNYAFENDANAEIHNCHHNSKPSFLQSTPCKSAFSKPLGFKSTSNVECRDFWTQTEAKAGKRRHSSIKKCSQEHGFSKNLPEPEPKIRSFSSPNISKPSNNISLSSVVEKYEDPSGLLTVYGALYVFGCNGTVPAHLVDEMDTKYVLRKQRKANGIKEAFSYVRSNFEPLCLSPSKHVISYHLCSNRSVVVAFKNDPLSDMFQIGRYEKHPIDFRVVDMNPSEKARKGVSRFACRILVRRDGDHEARVYAAAFDFSGTIFIGENGIPCSYSGKMDGFTTNGVLIRHPGNSKWREVSVSGYIYPLRSARMESSKRPRLFEESNVLQDGTMIDLCGVTLLWRTPKGLNKVPNEQFLSCLQSTLRRSVPECGLLKQPSNLQINGTKRAVKKAYVYICCGHVVGLTLSQPPEDFKEWSCPVCRFLGPIIELKIGAEPAFYIDREFPSHAFKPCGHAASLKTVEYWSSTEIPKHRSIQSSYCPFCGVKLDFIKKYVKLVLPTEKNYSE